ncbi:NAD(P)-dependent oxidoreductase [Chitinophaga pinensis]|uniref:6-phosphogluconate dehydrogenase NAD-binding n=1 Tax=Chitinophaga pinensis (strain ATCC 43595 / DSM 2588 / LMG 13176 / NBRC 15968 / NCIMB 11800 / UQM 2034) TaxID=485918 RepID=A0A979GBV6_CHIPD|nr:NAD(P)-dependent oxidoreductase [Chitinophaga pinensis]ACU64553.1 6-phosphogluconate dehydrogenase NAD-binding [Chitinophaga pinensis DSM 2588]
MNHLKIGWAGLGHMGVPMVTNLVKAGFDVTVYNRTTDKAIALQETLGVKVAHSPRELAESKDMIITMVTDDAALKEIYEGTDGVLSATLQRDMLAIDMSTVSPDTTRQLATLCEAAGIWYLDAPVSGSVKPAQEAQLVIMAGGRSEDFERAKPIFNALGKAAHLLGDAGAGNYAKLAINTFLGITLQGLSEAVIFAQNNGIPPAQFLPLINNGPIGSAITNLKATNIVNHDFTPAFQLGLLAKDIRLAKGQGLDTPIGNALFDTLQDALTQGLATSDMSAIYQYLENKYAE